MRLIPFAIAIIACSLTTLVQAQERPQRPDKLFTSAAEVESLIAKSKASHKGGNTTQTLNNFGSFPVQLTFRTGPTPPTVHKGRAELVYVISGGCTFITGGTLVDAKENGANLQGTSIQGGASQKLAKGDFVMVPPDVPHWYTDVQGEFITTATHVPIKR